MELTFVVTGVGGLTASLKALGENAKPKLAAALTQEAEAIMTAAKQQTPVDTGVLRDSGHVELPVIDADGVTVTMGFGGAAEAYALVQHEDLTLHHRVGKAKYLEQPFLERVNGLPERVSAAVFMEGA